VTTDETLRATLHVISTMQIDALRVLQAGTMSGPDVQRLLDRLQLLLNEVRQLQKAAMLTPDLYREYAAPGHSANVPSVN